MANRIAELRGMAADIGMWATETHDPGAHLPNQAARIQACIRWFAACGMFEGDIQLLHEDIPTFLDLYEDAIRAEWAAIQEQG